MPEVSCHEARMKLSWLIDLFANWYLDTAKDPLCCLTLWPVFRHALQPWALQDIT